MDLSLYSVGNLETYEKALVASAEGLSRNLSLRLPCTQISGMFWQKTLADKDFCTRGLLTKCIRPFLKLWEAGGVEA